ncbi:hypothetical protein THRCLA_05473, partial [Thraustotheca clavata]
LMHKIPNAAGIAGPPSYLTQKYSVRWAIFPFLVSNVMLFNLISMPMKAYITEDFPWTSMPTIPNYANFTEFNTTTLTLLQSFYNQHTLPTNSYYYEDQMRKVQIFRLPITFASPIRLNKCVQSAVLGLPGAVFYGPAMIDLLCEFAATNHSVNNAYSWDGRGTCIEQHYFGNKQTSQCLWLTFDNNTNNPLWILSFAVIRDTSALGNYAKFIYRISYCCLVIYLLWTKYYKHCFEIEKILQNYGLLENNGSDEWSYSIIIGDPTAMILTNPIVATAFTFDLMLSSSTNTLAVLRSSQNEDKLAMFSGMLYLSRGVWFPYLALSVLSVVLKKLKREHLFANIDPTVTVFIATTTGGAMAFCSGNIASLFHVIQQAHLCLVPMHLRYQLVEDLPPMSIHVFAVILVPLLYGFITPLFRFKSNVKIGPIVYSNSRYASLWYNPVKTRIILAIEKCFMSNFKGKKLGGSIYALFNSEPKYQQTPAISFCGSDCFVLCYQNHVIQYQIRLSLLSTLDRNLDNGEFAITDSKVSSPYSFNCLDIRANLKQSKQLKCSKVKNAWLWSFHCFVVSLHYIFTANHVKIAPYLPANSQYSTMWSNLVKTRAILAINRCFNLDYNCEKLGGSMHALFDTKPKYQQTPTISFYGADYFVLCYQGGILHSQIRLSLLSALDLHLDSKEYAKHDSFGTSPYTYNTLEMKANLIQLLRAKKKNVWGHVFC